MRRIAALLIAGLLLGEFVAWASAHKSKVRGLDIYRLHWDRSFDTWSVDGGRVT